MSDVISFLVVHLSVHSSTDNFLLVYPVPGTVLGAESIVKDESKSCFCGA